MKTAILLTRREETHRAMAEALGPATHLIAPPLPSEPTRRGFDALLAEWLPLADCLIMDAASLGDSARWALESLGAVPSETRPAIAVRATEPQRSVLQLSPDWLVVADTDSSDQLRRSLPLFLELRDAQARLRRAGDSGQGQGEAVNARWFANAPELRDPSLASRPASAAGGFDTYRYREALKGITRILGEQRDERALLTEFARMMHDLLALSRSAVFLRRIPSGWFGEAPVPPAAELDLAVSTGLRREVVQHLRLSATEGIAGHLAREGGLLLRARAAEARSPQISREFGLLGTEVAVPLIDNDQFLGVLTFGARITGDAFSVEELELAYHLAGQLARFLTNLRLRAELGEHQRMLAEVLARVPSGLVVIGPDERILSVNQSAAELMGLSAAEIVGAPLRALPSRIGDILFEVLQSGREVRQCELVLPPGNRPLAVSARQIDLAAARPDGGRGAGPGAHLAPLVVIGLLEDLTQVKLQQKQEQQEREREFFMRLGARLSHELKNSLVSIKIFAQLLPERYKDQDFREQFSEVVSNEVNRVDVLVNNLTFFAHPLELVCEPVDAAELLDRCLDNLAKECARRKQTRIVLPGSPPAEEAADTPAITAQRHYHQKTTRLEADRIRLIQALENVLRNAVQAMSKGGRLTVSVGPHEEGLAGIGPVPEGGMIRIQIQDSGEGVPLSLLPSVTEPFVTTRNVGIGLGLTIVRKIVERHSGRLTIDSVLGRGTTVTLMLPVRAQPHPQDALATRSSGLETARSDAVPESLTEAGRLSRPTPDRLDRSAETN